MSKLKKLTSVMLAAAMLSSVSATAMTANAAEKATADYNLSDNVQDGVILHAFNWSYDSIRENLAAIAAAGYTTVQTSPVQQPKDFCSSNDVAGQWWKLYQPVSFSIAEQSWLGTKDELKALCEEADKYGIKIICDIVSNHMGNEGENPLEVSVQLKNYDPEMYENRASYFRKTALGISDSNPKSIVQGNLSACPDLVTNDAKVQNKVIGLLKECIDCGVDGFRFDAAKHIETPDDGEFASDYWKNITEQAGSYYNAKTGDDLYIYGEILNTCGSGRSYSSYTKYINVTDNKKGDAVLYAVINGRAANAANANYNTGVNASDMVLWAESHDTYEGDSGISVKNTASVSDENIVKTWALVAARKDATSLYFARPGDSIMGEAAGNTTYKSVAVSEINKFHNLFAGKSEKLGASGSISYVTRGTDGIVLVNCGGTTASVNISATGLADGTYTDTITGNKFNVSGGVLTGEIGSTGVATVYNGTTTPRNTCSVESGEFEGETLTIKLGLNNATSGTYCIDNSEPVSYTGDIAIRVGSDYAYGETVNLTLTATDGNKTTETTYKYVKKEAASSGVYVFFDAAKREAGSRWVAPYNVYVYDEDTSSDMTYKLSSWPGTRMQYDEASGYYYVEIPTNCIGVDKDGNESEVQFDMAHSQNTRVIFSDSSNVNSAPRQYPSSGGLKLKGSSKLFSHTSTTSWEDTDLKPTVVDDEPATEVVQTGSSKTYKYGDVDKDGKIDVIDVTQLQMALANYFKLDNTAAKLADVNGDSFVDVKDVTVLQMYLAGYKDAGVAGQTYQPVQPQPTTKPTTAPTTAQPTTQPTTVEPTTAPVADEYTLYFKTQLTWITAMGTNLYAYDYATGESYQMLLDPEDYPNVYTASVPAEVTEVGIYRALEPLETLSTPSDAGPVYNLWKVTVDSQNNSVTLADDAKTTTTGPYVKEEKPEWTLDVVYVDNSQTKWKEVYIYGWGYGLNNEAYPMTQIEGTDIWMYELPEPMYPGSPCFLFKDTLSTWKNQTGDLGAVEGKNLYDLKAKSWSVYTP